MKKIFLLCFLFGFICCTGLGCGGAQERVPPRRPVALHDGANSQDCQPVTVDKQPIALRYSERRINESENLTRKATRSLRRSQKKNVDRNEAFASGVTLLVTALAADPYNVHATYSLAASYAQIGRHQCSLNLLQRLKHLRLLRSYQKSVDGKFDQLLGRRSYKNKRDKAFDSLRQVDGYRQFTRNL